MLYDVQEPVASGATLGEDGATSSIARPGRPARRDRPAEDPRRRDGADPRGGSRGGDDAPAGRHARGLDHDALPPRRRRQGPAAQARRRRDRRDGRAAVARGRLGRAPAPAAARHARGPARVPGHRRVPARGRRARPERHPAQRGARPGDHRFGPADRGGGPRGLHARHAALRRRPAARDAAGGRGRAGPSGRSRRVLRARCRAAARRRAHRDRALPPERRLAGGGVPRLGDRRRHRAHPRRVGAGAT